MSLSAMAHLQLNRLAHLSLVRAPAVVSAVKLGSFNAGFRSTSVGSYMFKRPGMFLLFSLCFGRGSGIM